MEEQAYRLGGPPQRIWNWGMLQIYNKKYESASTLENALSF